MNVIDHAILIPASPEFIWRFLGDLTQNENWQDDCVNISFLTTQHEGKGTRWRYSTSKGKDVIVEITAWYDTLGYEYTIIDGSSVASNQGRVRLQEIAEGTLVQWTFNYEVDGMLSGLRNSISLKRSLTNNIQDSLRNLYKLIQQETGGISTHEARSSLKEAPDVEQRSNYQPRHPSNFTEDNLIDGTYSESEYPSEESIQYSINEGIQEPPVADDDTKPNPLVQSAGEMEIVKPTSNSSLSIDEPTVADDDTKPNAPIVEADSISAPETPIDDLYEPSLDDDVILEPKPDIRDTSRISVFDVFGLQKPSETQNMRAITAEDLAESPVEASEEPAVDAEETLVEEQDEEIAKPESTLIENEESIEEISHDSEVTVREDETPTKILDNNEVAVSTELDEDADVIVTNSGTTDSPAALDTQDNTTLLGHRVKVRREMLELKRRNQK